MNKICPNCSSELPEEAHFCLHCFTDLTVPDGDPKALSKSKRLSKKRRTALVLSALAAAIAVAGAAAVYFSHDVLPVENSPLSGTGEAEPSDSKDGFFDFLFGKKEDTSSPEGTESASPTDPAGEAESSHSFWDTLFGKKDPEPQSPAPSPGSPENSGGAEPDAPGDPEPQPEPEYDRFEYEQDSDYKKGVSITKYTGNASKVTIPAMIDSKYVTKIETDAFKDNNKITEITFENGKGLPVLRLESECFHNLSSLTTVTLPDTDLGFWDDSIVECPQMRTINVTNWQYRFYEGGMYYYSGTEWRLRYYAPATPSSELVIPSWCVSIENVCDLTPCLNLKVIRLHDRVHSLSYEAFPVTLEAVYVDGGNPYSYDVDGVYFYKSGSRYNAYYPPGKKDRVFHVPENVQLDTVWLPPNPYLEEIWFPVSSGVNGESKIFHTKEAFPNLKTVYLQSGHSMEPYVRSTFMGNVFTY